MSVGGAVLLLVAKAGVDLLKPWPLALVFDHILKQGTLDGSASYLLIAVSSLVVAIALFGGLLDYLAALFVNRAGRTMVFELRAALFDHIQRVSLHFHSRRATGDLLTRVTSDVRNLKDIMTDDFAEVVYSSIFLIGMGTALILLDWQLGLVALGASPVLLLALLHFTSQIQEHSRAEKKREGALATVMHETLQITRLTRVFNQEGAARQRFQVESEGSLESGLAATLTSERFAWLSDIVGGAITAAVLGFGAQRVMDGAISAGTLIVVVSYVRDFYKPMKSAIKHASNITKSVASAERVEELLEVSEDVTDLPGARRAPRFAGHVEFQDVGFEYEPSRPALQNINLAVEPGSVTALVGHTGAGKTTLCSLIPRLYDPTQGAVLIDGADIREYTLESLRSQITIVFQESVLLRASIAENIAYGRPSATVSEIVAAAKAANAHDFIVQLPEGYDTEVGERGDTLSGGQRQRIAIARAIIRNAPIVIMDEPLAGLDAVSARAVADALEELMRGRTVIIITHQLGSIQRADTVAVMEGGRIVERGAPEDLMAARGRYRQLFDAQFQDVTEGVL